MITRLFHKKSKHGGLGTYLFEKNSKILTWEILNKGKLYPCKFREIVLHPFEILRTNMKTYFFFS